MTIAKMKKFQIIGHKKELNSISHQILENSNIQLEEYEKFLQDESREEIMPIVRDNPYTSVVNRIESLASDINLDLEISSIPDMKNIREIDIEHIRSELDSMASKINRITNFSEKLKQEEERLKDIKRHIWVMRDMDVDVAELRKLEHISLIFGRVSSENYNRLINNISDWPILVVEVYREEEDVWFFSFTKKEYEEKALNFLNSVYFERFELPDRVHGKASEILERAAHRLRRIEIGYSEIELELKKFRHLYGKKLLRYYSQMKIMNKFRELDNQYYGQLEFLFILNGWITEFMEDKFTESIEDKFPDVIYVSQEASLSEDDPPTVLKNKRWVKPFETLVKLYGVPVYGEIDPSPFLAISYLLMFGMMFGDVGQGAVFALIGFLSYKGYFKIMGQNAGLLMAYLGVSSILFGFLYGSVFGLEDILPALWMKPMDNIMLLLGLTVGLGILLMLISMTLNLVNSARNGDIEEGIFSENGLSGIFFYVFSLITVFYLFTRGNLLFNFWVTLILLIVPLVLILFKEPLSNLVQKRDKILDEELGSYFLEAGFELFDAVISFLSNTISFVRIGAFTLNHIGLFMAVFIMAEMISKTVGGLLWSGLVIIFGNILIMLLEGLVVGIQVLRLEYFEIFGKFYRGNGKEFLPVKLD